MKMQPWPRKFEFPQKLDERAMRTILPFMAFLGAIFSFALTRDALGGLKMGLFTIELFLGFSLGAMIFTLLDASPLADASLYAEKEHPPLRNMLLIILTWGCLTSISLVIGSLAMGVPFIGGPLIALCAGGLLYLMIPSLCWNLRMLYRKVSK